MSWISKLFKKDDLSVDMQIWENDGYYVLPKFYSNKEIDAALLAQTRIWEEEHPRIVVDDLMTGRRSKISEVDSHSAKNHRFKLNDLYLELEPVRNLAINDRISPILNQLMGQKTVLCNSLSFDKGSAQPDHVDALYMTPKSHGHLLAIWVALEDCHADAGPLRYYPGSHKIKQYVFSDGSTHASESEMDSWRNYIAEELSLREIKPMTFNAKKGDVFIWSAYLLHGGSPIKNNDLTRKSIVFHYYSEEDALFHHSQIIESGAAYWMRRAHQPTQPGVPGDYPPET